MANIIKRLEHGLPSSPRKQHFVVQKLAKSVGVPVCSSSKKSTSAESEEQRELVHSFYRTDDISWQAPQRKDRIIIRKTTEEGDRIKTTQQVRYMMMSLWEAYNKFIEQHSTMKMSLSKFCELRPPNVKLLCLCSYHENVRLLLVVLKEHSSLSTKFSSFVEQVTCDATSKKRMTQECSTCVDLIDEFAPQSSSVTLQYYQWKSTDSRIEKVVMTDTVDAIFLMSWRNSWVPSYSVPLWRKASCFVWLLEELLWRQIHRFASRFLWKCDNCSTERSTSSPLAPCSGNDLPHSRLDQQCYQFQYGGNFRRPQPHEIQHFRFHAMYFPKSLSEIPKHKNCQCFQQWANFSV